VIKEKIKLLSYLNKNITDFIKLKFNNLLDSNKKELKKKYYSLIHLQKK